jgi:cysteinyl-tRNA synthetase
VLWKAATPGEPTWESPWGPGRPGWHIEDTAITVRLFGPRYDLHGGGLDLKFPHHEAEIAQAEGATGESPLVNFWMHVGLLTMKGEKMSKSLGNVFGLVEALEKFGPDVVRFYYLNAHYRSPLDFVPGKSLEEAAEAYRTLAQAADRLRHAAGAGAPRSGTELSDEDRTAAAAAVDELDGALTRDFHTREAIAVLFGWAKRVQERGLELAALSSDSLEALRGPFDWASEVLGLFGGAASAGSEALEAAVGVALAARARARARGDFPESDRIRAELAASGIVIEDDGTTTRWHLATAGR